MADPMRIRGLIAILAWLAIAAPAAAQGLPSEPLAFAGGRLTVGADVSASIGGHDAGFFDYTDYDHSSLRTPRIDVTGAYTASEHFALLGELRTENAGNVVPYALYARIRPWASRHLDIQVGR